MQTNAAGQVVLKLKPSWRDGTTHLVMSPLEFMQRLAALVPRPRLHLIRFHGVLAPNAKLRALVVPKEPEPPAQAAPPAECEAKCAHRRPVPQSWAKLLKRVFEIDMETPGKTRRQRYERHPLGLRSVFNGLVPRPTTMRVRVRQLGGGCSGRKKGV